MYFLHKDLYVINQTIYKFYKGQNIMSNKLAVKDIDLKMISLNVSF